MHDAGTLFGYRIAVAGPDGPPHAARQWRLASGLTIITADRERAFAASVRPYTLDSLVSLAQRLTALRLVRTAEMKSDLAKVGWDTEATFQPFSIRSVVTRGIRIRALPDAAERAIDAPALMQAEQIVRDIVPRADADSDDGEPDDISALALRMLQAQFSDQAGYYNFEFEIYLAERTIELAAQLGLDLNQLFRDTFGIQFDQMTFVSYGMLSSIAADPNAAFDKTSLMRSDDFLVSQEVVDAYWAHCTATYADVQRESVGPSVYLEGYESYALSPLTYWPLLIRSDGLAVAPVLGDLLYRGTRGFMIDCWHALASGGTVSDEGTLRRASGGAYEDYVGDTFAASAGAGDLYHGDELLPEGGRSCDWICVEDAGTTLIEVKSSWFALQASMTKSRAALKAELAKDGSVADALEQLADSTEEIRAGQTNLPAATELVGLVVLRGEQVAMNSPYVRQILHEILAERGRAPLPIDIEITNDVDFYELARHVGVNGSSMFGVVADKCRDAVHSVDEMGFFVDQRNLAQNRHPLAARFDEAHRQLIGRFVPRFLSDERGRRERAR